MLHVFKTHHRWPRSKNEKQPLNPNKEPTTQTPISHGSGSFDANFLWMWLITVGFFMK